jgi:hypothetical protein
MMVRSSQKPRRLQVITAIVMMVCFLALLIPHSGSSGPFVASCVLFFPVFLFGLLDLQQLLRNVVRADETFLPQAPVLTALFQRPPPAFD